MLTMRGFEWLYERFEPSAAVEGGKSTTWYEVKSPEALRSQVILRSFARIGSLSFEAPGKSPHTNYELDRWLGQGSRISVQLRSL